MSRFSPPSLLGHPGLSQAAAAAAAAGHHHLPQIKQELNCRTSNKNSPSKYTLITSRRTLSVVFTVYVCHSLFDLWYIIQLMKSSINCN